MSAQPQHVFFGTSLDEWMTGYTHELEDDIVGLWQIVPTLRKGFGLTGDALESATRKVMISLLDRGAHPITGSTDKPDAWKRVTRYGQNPMDIADSVIAEWRASGHDPDFGDVWFGLPGTYFEE